MGIEWEEDQAAMPHASMLEYHSLVSFFAASENTPPPISPSSAALLCVVILLSFLDTKNHVKRIMITVTVSKAMLVQ